MTSDTAYLEPLRDFAKGYSKEIVERYSGKSLTLGETTLAKINSFPLTCRTIAGGSQLEILFQVHYCSEAVNQIIPDKSIKSTNRIDDFVREIGNVVSGKLKASLEDDEIDMSQGLPFTYQAPPIEGTLPSNMSIWSLCFDGKDILNLSLTVDVKEDFIYDRLNNFRHPGTDASDALGIELF